MASIKEKLKSFFLDYSQVTTIGGLVYVFRKDYSIFKRLFWIMVIISMVVVGIYWSEQIFVSWKENQVLVTIDSVGDDNS
jgi:hypothetical protein